MVHKEIYIELQDTQWQFDYIDHDRNIARAIVYDENGIFYFVRAERDDDFGKATLIETAGGGVEGRRGVTNCHSKRTKRRIRCISRNSF